VHTRTHVHFWGEDDLKPLKAQVELMRIDMESRAPYLTAAQLSALKARHDNLVLAVRFCGDQAD